MENRVGDHIPSENEINAEVKSLDAMRKKTDAFGCSLSVEERRTRTRFRPGGEKVVADVARIAKKYGIDNDDTPVAGMLADLALAARVRPAAAAAQALADRFSDTEMEAESECWHACTALYSQLSERAKNNAELRAELADAKAFFATGKRRKLPPATPAT